MATVAENLLYECLRELSYVQENEECTSNMCASSNGRELIERGMIALQVKELAEETLDAQKLKEWNKLYAKDIEKLSPAMKEILARKYHCSKCGYPLEEDNGLCADCGHFAPAEGAHAH